jgi:hypothetical protein
MRMSGPRARGLYWPLPQAGVAQSAERLLPKQKVAGSSPVPRSDSRFGPVNGWAYPRPLGMLLIAGAKCLNRVVLAFRSLFDILVHGQASEDVATALSLSSQPAAAPIPEPSVANTSDGALQLLAMLQRDSRLLDFLMEDVSSYSDDQIGAAVRTLHDQSRDSVLRYVTLEPVVDGVEGTFMPAPSASPETVKFVGNVPAQPPGGGILRHRGWRAARVELPRVAPTADITILAPAEFEIE